MLLLLLLCSSLQSHPAAAFVMFRDHRVGREHHFPPQEEEEEEEEEEGSHKMQLSLERREGEAVQNIGPGNLKECREND